MSSGSTGGCSDAKTLILLNTSFGDIIKNMYTNGESI